MMETLPPASLVYHYIAVDRALVKSSAVIALNDVIFKTCR